MSDPPRLRPSRLATLGPRTRGHQDAYADLLELIHEGSELHYADAGGGEEADSRLLLGDQRYAEGLVRLSALGDLEAVRELADVISLVAQAHAAGDPDLADAAWEAGAVAIGWGSTPGHAAAKTRARAGEPAAAEVLRAAAAAARAGGS